MLRRACKGFCSVAFDMLVTWVMWGIQLCKANVAVFCCHASHLSSEACWGAKEPGGALA